MDFGYKLIFIKAFSVIFFAFFAYSNFYFFFIWAYVQIFQGIDIQGLHYYCYCCYYYCYYCYYYNVYTSDTWVLLFFSSFFFVARRSPDNLCTPIRNVVNCRMRAYGNFCGTKRIRTTHKSDKKRISRNTSQLANK